MFDTSKEIIHMNITATSTIEGGQGDCQKILRESNRTTTNATTAIEQHPCMELTSNHCRTIRRQHSQRRRFKHDYSLRILVITHCNAMTTSYEISLSEPTCWADGRELGLGESVFIDHCQQCSCELNSSDRRASLRCQRSFFCL